MIKQFYETFKNSYVQTFDDTKQGRSGFVKMLPMQDLEANNLKVLNEEGAGVFFTPNPCKGGRKEENVTNIEWVYADLDEGTKPEMMERIKKSPFYPHVITESSRGYHLLWRVDCSREQFDKIIAGLIYFYDSDPAISSTNEVLRLPPFKHMKDPKNPFPVQVLRFDLSEQITAENMLEAYPEPHKSFQVKFEIKDDDLGILKTLPIVDVLRKLGVDVRRSSIFENGKETSAKINTAGNYINRFSRKNGSGSTIDAVMAYGNLELKDAIEWLRKEFGLEKKTVIKQIEEVEEIDPINEKCQVFTWGTNNLNRKITPIKSDQFIVLAGETGSGKTTFCFDVAWKNAIEGKKVLFLSLEMTKNQILTRAARSYAGITKEDWRNPSAIAQTKKDLYLKRKEEFNKLDNLILSGFPDGVPKNTANIFAMIEQIKPDLTFVDNFDLIEKDDKAEYAEQNRIAGEFMNLAKDKKRPIIVLHHFNKGKDDKGQRGLDSIRGSGKITHNAHSVLICYRVYDEDATPEANAKFTILQKKDRDFGQQSLVNIYFKNGSFQDDYNPSAALEFWQNNI